MARKCQRDDRIDETLSFDILLCRQILRSEAEIKVFVSFNPLHLNPGEREKINLSFYFHPFLWCLKRFNEGL